MPARFTCEGENATPHLSVAGAPSGAKSLALIVDDPDAPDPAAPKRTWVHWVVYDLPVADGELKTSAGRAGKSDFNASDWRGPCPPIGKHRYFFKLYALDVQLGDRGRLTKAELEKAIEGHVLEKTELIGTYEKNKH
ncbi:MAG TPA: YbhB/YbcL family Raf kinase inhibitor-like protein [Myxococcota bacterium]|nr:YbhB/YbcL family Raf kinase inhibitor-like protein [Myxococcota bacterium]